MSNISDISIDPHIDRLIEAIDFINQQTQRKAETEFSETCAALLEHIAQGTLAPVPAMSIVQFIGSSGKIPAKTLLTAKTTAGEACYFTTGYDVANLPIKIVHASLAPHKTAKSALCIQLAYLPDMQFDHLCFFIRAQPVYAYRLYELLFKHTQCILLADSPQDPNPIVLDKKYLRAEGFSKSQALIPYHPRKNREQILLTEFFKCPEKFMFFSCEKLQPHKPYLYFLFDAVSAELEKQLNADFFALNCTPIINLFPAISEPLKLDHTKHDYLLKARLNHLPEATEIYDIQSISACNNNADETVFFHPIYSSTYDIGAHPHHFYHTHRKEEGIYLAFYTPNPALLYPSDWTITAEILCSNHHLPAQLPYGGNAAPIYFADKTDNKPAIKLLMPFTAVQDAALDGHSVINKLLLHLFINQSPQSILTLKNTLQLFGGRHKDLPHLLSAITALTHKSSSHQHISGVDISLSLETEKISNSQLFFWGCILDRYFAFQAEVNVYTRLTLINHGQTIFQWPARCGEGFVLP